MCQMKWCKRTLVLNSRIVLILCTVVCFLGCTATEHYDEPLLKGSQVSSTETININTANARELQSIPYIGERLAEEIIGHRERYGPFRKAEHLMLLQGISDRRFREIRHLIRAD